ncbi:MAG: tetratricopeptide repeat protein, partial [Candidatus Omnitrophica bacterium]|nr:tetratricopeptide repeat protein [Candidatus Omnitrophota bacterium]
MKLQITVFSIFLLFFIYFFVVYDTGFHGPDEPVYLSYTSSVAEDGDLNIINQDYGKVNRLIISHTYNAPNFHNHGGIVLWVPFYLYAKIIYYLAIKLSFINITNFGIHNIIKCVMSFSTIAFCFITLILIYILYRLFFSNKVVIWSIVVMFFGTPFFYYVLFQSGNANIIACLFTILSIWFCLQAESFKRFHWFTYGLLFSMCVSVRSELWLQIFFIAPFFIILSIQKRISLKHGIYFILGFLVVFILRGINAYIKYGTLHMEEIVYLLPYLQSHFSYSIGVIFSSHKGLLYNTPIIYLCLWGFILILVGLLAKIRDKKEFKNIQDLLFLILSGYLIIKLLLFGRLYYAAGTSVGMPLFLADSTRAFLAEFPIFVLLYARIFQTPNKYIKYFYAAISLFFVFWNLIIIFEHIAGLDWINIIDQPSIISRVQSIKYMLDFLFLGRDLSIKLWTCLPLSLIVLGIGVYLINIPFRVKYLFWEIKNMDKLIKLLSIFTLYASLTYFSITVANAFNNSKNVDKLKQQDFFQDSEIIDTPAIKLTPIEKDQRLRNLFDMMRYFTLKGDLGRVYEVREFRRQFFGQKESDIFSYPTKAYYELAETYLTQRRFKKAIDNYKKIIAQDPMDIDALIGLSDIYIVNSQYDEAQAVLKRAIELNPKSINANRRLADLFIKINDLEQAARYYQNCLVLSPGSVDVYNKLGDIYFIIGDYKKAKTYYEMTIKIFPENVDTLFKLADVYSLQGEDDKALEIYKKCIRINPASSLETYRRLSEAYRLKGEDLKRVECLEQGLRAIPDSLTL